ncbi:DUF1003 domain-containing protein [Lacipirellula parvula]|uniref:DUF1003 domain-containing protein n=1 Tax=Lacipirellula parvula TaxID=2650471 RepID=A0A5K7XMI2_9BACT|nr:DUF1003 domain-containing protein [Lacipirellula parvula]BBO34259.1 hypothetical protein PLANPX_3871 [Lacipirellula parvula]
MTYPSLKKCGVCGLMKPSSQMMPGDLVRAPIASLIEVEHPQWSADQFICLEDLNTYRALHIEKSLIAERGELSSLEREVVDSLREHELLSANVDDEFIGQRTLGDRLSDRLAAFGGSWSFLILFTGGMAMWIGVNAIVLRTSAFDAYPFILLNLVLSFIAAIQAPVIMMSQNRLEARDRMRAEHDYRINLKAELEIRHLHVKLDELMSHQWERMMEIQQMEVELMTELCRGKNR